MWIAVTFLKKICASLRKNRWLSLGVDTTLCILFLFWSSQARDITKHRRKSPWVVQIRCHRLIYPSILISIKVLLVPNKFVSYVVVCRYLCILLHCEYHIWCVAKPLFFSVAIVTNKNRPIKLIFSGNIRGVIRWFLTVVVRKNVWPRELYLRFIRITEAHNIHTHTHRLRLLWITHLEWSQKLLSQIDNWNWALAANIFWIQMPACTLPCIFVWLCDMWCKSHVTIIWFMR